MDSDHLGFVRERKRFCEHEWNNENVRDIEAREYREARVPGPRGPRAGRLSQACEVRASLQWCTLLLVLSTGPILSRYAAL